MRQKFVKHLLKLSWKLWLTFCGYCVYRHWNASELFYCH